MVKEPKNKRDEELDEDTVDRDAVEVAETLPGYREYMREQHSENLTFGDY